MTCCQSNDMSKKWHCPRRRHTTTSSSKTSSIFAAAPFLFLLFQTHFQIGYCFVPSAQLSAPARKTRYSSPYLGTRIPSTCINGSGKDDDNANDLQEKINNFLDTPFFDPDDESIVEEGASKGWFGSFRAWFAFLVKDDYETAEALYAGLFFAVLLFATQELLRMQMYGTDYVPFTRGGSGRLW